MFTFSYFRKNPGFLAGTFKSAKSTIKRFALLNFDLRHLYPSLPIRLMGCYCTLINYKLHWPICQFIFLKRLCALWAQSLLRLMGPSGPRVLRIDSSLQLLRVVVSPWRAISFIVSVTGLTFVSPLLHDVVRKPPSPGRRWRRQATEDRGVSSFLIFFGPILRASPSSFLGKEPPLRDWLLLSPVLHNVVQESPSTAIAVPLPLTSRGEARYYGIYFCVTSAA